MEQTELAEVWRVLGERVFAEMSAWRKAHPKATLKEIEDELDARLAGMRAQMIADLAEQSPRRDWRGQESEQRPHCPQCGGPFQARGQHERKLATQGGVEVKLSRSYGTCPHCGSGLFPAFMRNWTCPPVD